MRTSAWPRAYRKAEDATVDPGGDFVHEWLRLAQGEALDSLGDVRTNAWEGEEVALEDGYTARVLLD
ncbi:MAG: hypothetical protein M0027_03745 [Candidatus Dormibacteraeota bacterium]|nr:hypothetical protein [Candidatus Dormibacteraeota bacterium]